MNVGDGVEISSDKVRVKLDGTSLTRGGAGLKVTIPPITVASTAPAGPVSGQLWLDTA